MALRQVPIRRAAHRHNLFLGCDRELVMLSGLICSVLIFVAMDWTSFIVGTLFWFFTLGGLRLMAKKDPLLRQVYMRHRLYKKYYPARSTPFRKNISSKRRGY